MMQEIGVGLIGYGLGGRAFHAPYVLATPGMALRAVVSRDPAKVHAGLPGMQVVPDVDALLALHNHLATSRSSMARSIRQYN